ncbi:MAG TPA: Na+/H+ antiporter NhaA, partial [Microbacteriaceae bacterium]|nr:Na+/H+ antiporter NhaA [Microbacteriaceae bacterium]
MSSRRKPPVAVREETGPFLGLTVIRSSPDPDHADAQRHRPRSLAERIGAIGHARLGAMLLLAATVAAIVWANVANGSYADFWETHLTFGVGDLHLDFTLHALVNDALMAIFFFTVGLEVRREFAIGELTSRSRAIVPVVAAVFGLAVPALLFFL